MNMGWLDSPTEVMAHGPSLPTCIMSAMETSVMSVISVSDGRARLMIFFLSSAADSEGRAAAALPVRGLGSEIAAEEDLPPPAASGDSSVSGFACASRS